ncbi:MAG TPA: ATP-binding protein [Solirubrobacteraceae bacterium]|jgi:anti-sigma regulatory factor (Ser/Thr protein kinase)
MPVQQISSSTTDAADEREQIAPREADDELSAPAGMRMESVVWGAPAPLSPILLTATERRFKFRGMPQAVGAARRALRRWEGHFEPDMFYDLSLCVSELVTNTVHQAEAVTEEIELVVRRGAQFARAEVKTPRRDVAVSPSPVATASGWGMFIVDRVADRWGVVRGEGTAVWCEIDLASDGWSRSTPPIGAQISS